VLETFAALGESNRYRIVGLLRSGPRAVNDIGARLGLNQPQVSKHLRVLKHAGIVDVQPHAQQRLYELRPESLRAMAEWLELYRDIWKARFDELDALIDEIKSKENPRVRRTRTSKK
jgi:DNA-binding transcriptional ArsR family regulator